MRKSRERRRNLRNEPLVEEVVDRLQQTRRPHRPTWKKKLERVQRKDRSRKLSHFLARDLRWKTCPILFGLTRLSKTLKDKSDKITMKTFQEGIFFLTPSFF